MNNKKETWRVKAFDKTIDEKFDDEAFDFDNWNKVKAFYNNQVKEMLKKMVGEEIDKDTTLYEFKDDKTILDWQNIPGYNYKRKRIIKIAAKYGFNLE